jgi:hypothetical protein
MPAWTYSQLDSFESCPKKFFHLKVARDVVEPPSPHTEWGTRVHTAFEDALQKQQPLPEGMTQWQGLVNKISRLPGEKFTEIRLALDSSFNPTDWKTAWSRGVADLLVVCGEKAAVLDYKTGKRKPSEQLDLYANYVFHHYPDVQTVRTGYIWLKDRRIDWKSHNRKHLHETWQTLLPRVRKLESAYERESWPARPSGLCNGWCPVTTCPFFKARR